MKKQSLSDAELSATWVKLHGRNLRKFLKAQAKRSAKEYRMEKIKAMTRVL